MKNDKGMKENMIVDRFNDGDVYQLSQILHDILCELLVHRLQFN